MRSFFNRELLPPTRTFYDREGCSLGRERKDWAQGRCPFHKSKSGRSFSVNIDNGAFHCFGCGVHGGDVISFVRLRDGCDFPTACKTLGIWRNGVAPAERTEMVRRQQERAWDRQRATEKEQGERRERLRLRDELHVTISHYQQAAGELRQHGPDADEYWSPLPLLLDDWRWTESD